MGCGTSRQGRKRNEHKLPTDCSGQPCNFLASDNSGADLIAAIPADTKTRILAELVLMDIDTLNAFTKVVDLGKLPANNGKIEITEGTMEEKYVKIIEFINEYGADIKDSHFELLKSASPYPPVDQPSPIIGIFSMILAFYMTSTKVPWKLSVWYDNYVEMLYKTIINEPPYTPDEVNEQVTKWLTANMPPLFEGFTSKEAEAKLRQRIAANMTNAKQVSGFTNQNTGSDSLQDIVGNVKKIQPVSGFTDFKPFDGLVQRNRFKNDYHSF
jgi:hypothetical protein